MPKVHPPTERDAAIITNAVRFDLALFIGRGKYAHASAQTLTEARTEAAPSLEAEHPYGRRALIYAIDADGRSALVTNNIPTETKESPMKTYAKKFNAQRAAKAAGHDLDEIEIVKAKGRLYVAPEATAETRRGQGCQACARCIARAAAGRQAAPSRQAGGDRGGGARRQAARAAGFQRGHPQTFPQQARKRGRTRQGRRPQGTARVRGQSGQLKSEGNQTIPRSLHRRDRSAGGALRPRWPSYTRPGPFRAALHLGSALTGDQAEVRSAANFVG